MCIFCDFNTKTIIDNNAYIIKRRNLEDNLILYLCNFKDIDNQKNIFNSQSFLSAINKLNVIGNEMFPDGYRISINFGADAMKLCNHPQILLSGGKLLSGL